MNPNIDFILNTFYQKGITSREQLLTEILRVKKTLEIIKYKNNEKVLNDKEKLFQLMKKSTEQEFGFFPGDRDFFLKLFELYSDVDLFEFTLELYSPDRKGIVIAPACFLEFIYIFIDEKDATDIHGIEAEKHLLGLVALAERYPEKKFTFAMRSPQMYLMLSLCFEKYKNVKVIYQSIFSKMENEDLNLIHGIPMLTGKRDEFINQTNAIAI